MEKRLRIHVNKLPSNIFVGISTQLEVCIVDDHNNVISGTGEEFFVTLLYEDGTPVNDSVNTYILNNKSGNGYITDGTYSCFSMIELSYAHSNKKFMFKFEATKNHSIQQTFSYPFSVVNYKLIIKNQIPDEWFKDEGGKRNHIPLEIELINSSGMPVTAAMHGERRIPLKLTLLYDDYSAVRTTNQSEGSSIFKIVSDQSMCIDETGHCKLDVRIESVSKNHNNKKFIIYIYPDLTNVPQNADIASVSSTPIKVKSKRSSKSGVSFSLSFLERSSEEMDFSSVSNNDLLKLFSTSSHDLTQYDIESAVASIFDYSTKCNDLLQTLHSQVIGQEEINGSSLEIRRCPCCRGYNDNRKVNSNEVIHDPKCGQKYYRHSKKEVRTNITPIIPLQQQSMNAYSFPPVQPMMQGPMIHPISQQPSIPVAVIPNVGYANTSEIENAIETVYFDASFININQFPAVNKNDEIIGFISFAHETFSVTFVPIDTTKNPPYQLEDMLSKVKSTCKCISRNNQTFEAFKKAVLTYIVDFINNTVA